MEDNIKHIELRTSDDKTTGEIKFIREDDKALTLTLSPETLLALITKLKAMYDKLQRH